MANCSKCGKKTKFLDRVFFRGLCASCKKKELDKEEKEIKFRKAEEEKRKEVISLINNYIELHNRKGKDEIQKIYSYDENIEVPHKKEFLFINLDKVINMIIKESYNVEEAITESIDEELIKIEAEKIKERQKKRNIREQAEKKLYGDVKTKRIILTEEEKDMVFGKFNNECAVCRKTEGLHIHHKDENPSNNQMNNLVVLCGVCHKKTHMKIR